MGVLMCVCVGGAWGRTASLYFILLFFAEFSVAIQAATIAGPFRIFTMPRRVIPAALRRTVCLCRFQFVPNNCQTFVVWAWLSPVTRN